ncbi:MAG TPA: hypothetical protein VM784_07350 [Actinomycetota bacterium]|nr:hypothetical protein [Actinomycetota bacterium]
MTRMGIRRVVALIMAAGMAAGGVPAAATGVMSDNVEWVGNVPYDAGLATGARLVRDHLYVAGSTRLSIYDVSDPAHPVRLSTTPYRFQFANEDVDTNGTVLLMADDQVRGGLHVWNVEDKAAPKEIAVLEGLIDHTFTCVLDCAWAYGSLGSIVDLRDPARPKLAGSWAPGMRRGDGFDVTEVAPGVVVTASRTIRLLDARTNPTKPKERAIGMTLDGRLIHSNRWPRRARDRFLLVQGETPLTPRCGDTNGAFMTWDASRWKKTHSFTMIDEYRARNGTYTDGNPPANAFGCTNMWFQEHPKFRNGGFVASAFFEHGTRFLNVDRRGKISEVGYFAPAGGSTIATYWITNEIVYAIDLVRGIDILRFTAPKQ